MANTNRARIVVFGVNQLESKEEIRNVKTSRSTVGGWSQARYQRHVEKFHKQHAKEVVDVLDRIVRDEGIKHVILAGDEEVIIPLLKEEMPKHLQEILVDVLRLDPATSDQKLLETTMATLQADNEGRDKQTVDTLMSEYRSDGLAVAGVIDTYTALEKGQVDELLLAANPNVIETPEESLAVAPKVFEAAEDEESRAKIIADALVTIAQKTAAKVTFIENEQLLTGMGGCAALLRYKV